MDLRCLQVVEPPHNRHHHSTHFWSRPRRVASLHLRATLSRAIAQHLSLVSNPDTLTHYILKTDIESFAEYVGNTE